MSFIIVIECIGLIRMRSYPLEVNVFTVLDGFALYEWNFVPNWIVESYPVGYDENALPSIIFAIQNHNFFNNLGSSI